MDELEKEIVKYYSEKLFFAVSKRYEISLVIATISAAMLVVATFNEELLPNNLLINILVCLLLVVIPIILFFNLHDLNKLAVISQDKLETIIKEEFKDKNGNIIDRLSPYIPWMSFYIITITTLIFIIIILSNSNMDFFNFLNNSFITVDTFRYLFSAMPQTLGAIIALSATFFILIYDKTKQEKENYFNRLIRALSAVEHVPYGEIFDRYTTNDLSVVNDLDGKISAKELDLRGKIEPAKSNQLIHLGSIENILKNALSFSAPSLYTQDYLSIYSTRYSELFPYAGTTGISDNDPVKYNFDRIEYLIKIYKDEIKWNENEYISYFNRLENLKKNIKYIYFRNLVIIGILTLFLTLADLGFKNDNINILGTSLLLLGLLFFVYGLFIIGKSIFKIINQK